MKTLQRKLEVLQKNIAVLKPEDLTGRYANAYKRLKTEIAEEANRVAKSFIMSCIPFGKLQESERELFVKEVNRILEKTDFSDMCHAIFKEYNAEKFLVLLHERVCPQVMCAFKPYWDRHTTMCEGQRYNNLVDMYFSEEFGCWQSADARSFYYPGSFAS